MKKQYLVAGLLISLSFDATSSKASGRVGGFERDLQEKTSQATIASQVAFFEDSEIDLERYHKYEAYRNGLLRDPHLIFHSRHPSEYARVFIEALRDPMFQSTILELRNHDMFKAAYTPVLESYLQSCSKEEKAAFLKSIAEIQFSPISVPDERLVEHVPQGTFIPQKRFNMLDMDGRFFYNLTARHPLLVKLAHLLPPLLEAQINVMEENLNLSGEMHASGRGIRGQMGLRRLATPGLIPGDLEEDMLKGVMDVIRRDDNPALFKRFFGSDGIQFLFYKYRKNIADRVVTDLSTGCKPSMLKVFIDEALNQRQKKNFKSAFSLFGYSSRGKDFPEYEFLRGKFEKELKERITPIVASRIPPQSINAIPSYVFQDVQKRMRDLFPPQRHSTRHHNHGSFPGWGADRWDDIDEPGDYHDAS
jgi:hypothetical protein